MTQIFVKVLGWIQKLLSSFGRLLKNDPPVCIGQEFGLSIFYFTGVHEDYHKPSDTVDKIAFDYMKKVSELAYLIGKEIANRDEMIKLDADPNVTSRGKHNIKKN